jgi:aconitase A
VAKGFARIHRANLIAQGILPFVFVVEEDYVRAAQGQAWSIPVDLDLERVEADTPSGPVALKLGLTSRERAILRAGGLLAYAR